MNVSTTFKWKPLEDLPPDYHTLASSELAVLATVWKEQEQALSAGEALREFNERLQREWAIEAGIIERVYTLDRGITQLLIERGIDASLIPREATDRDPGLVAQIIRDHKEAVEGLFDFVKRQRPLSTSYIKELHALLMRHQETSLAVNTLGRQVQVPLLKGEYKALPNNPTRPDGTVHEYCPPEHVASEMDRLIALHLDHESRGVPPDVEAAWLHHRFSQIHPFQDGNGRVARALASLIFIRAGWFPLTVTRDHRERYIGALEAADRGTLGDFLDLFASIQKRAFVNALGIAAEVRREVRVDQVIAAARETLKRRPEALWREWEKAKETARALQTVAGQRMGELARRLQTEIGPYAPNSRFYVNDEPPDGPRSYWFRQQIIATAKALSYFANPALYSSWVRLVLRTETIAEILLSFHGVGHEYRGILVASLCFFRREEVEEGERETAGLTPISDEIFQINYREGLEEARKRFVVWLERGLLKALEVWRMGL